MPAPELHGWTATDFYLYRFIYNPLSRTLCGISPNVITGLSFLMTFPILQTVLNREALSSLLTLVFIRQSLDCLDGAVARNCNACSKLGAYLDIWSDIVSLVLFLGVLTYHTLLQSRWFLAGILGISGVYLGTTMTLQAVKEYTNKRSTKPYANALDTFINHNTVVFMMIAAWGLHWVY